jgi:hypothetical protein
MSHWFVRAHLSDVDGRLATEGAVDQLEAATTAVALQPGSVVSEDVSEDEDEDPAES